MKIASAIAAREERYISRHVAFLRGSLAEGRSLF